MLFPLAEEEEDVEVKQTYVSQYENMQITAVFQPCLAQKLTDSQSNSPHSKGTFYIDFNKVALHFLKLNIL